MEENNPLVSIVIMTCNRQNMLKNAIDAAFSQTYRNIEVICILGMNSVDMSEEMLTELRAKNLIKFVKNYGNRIDARNKGFELATGKYVCFLDDDDSMLANKVQKQVEFLESNPNIDVVSCATMLNNQVGLMHTFKNLSSVDINNLLMNGLDIDEVVNFQSCMFRKESIDKAFDKQPKFDKIFIAGGEGQFFIYDCMFNHNLRFANISDTIYIYFVGQARNSLSNLAVPVFYNKYLFGKTFDEKFKFVTQFKELYPTFETAQEPTKTPTEKPKRSRKNKAPQEPTKAPTEKPKRNRKKNTPQESKEAPTEKPKRIRKKKAAENA